MTTDFVDPTLWIAVTVMWAVAEGLDLSVYGRGGRVGVTAGDGLFFPILVGFAVPQVLISAVVAASGVGLLRWRGRLHKELLNVAQYGVAAAAATGIYTWLAEAGHVLSARNAAVAALSVLVFASLSHVFVSLAIALVHRESFIELTKDVAPTTLVNFGANLVLGFFLTAAYVAAEWAVFLFPVPVAAIYFAVRGISGLNQERERVERLHVASRALTSEPVFGAGLLAFLSSAAETVSSTSASVILPTDRWFSISSVERGEIVSNLTPLEDPHLLDLVARLESDREPLLAGEEAAAGMSARNLIAVPISTEKEWFGVLLVRDRVGAGEFGDSDVAILVALANELALTLESRRLLDEVTRERERFHVVVEAVRDYAIYMLDPKGLVVSWNAGAERITGYKTGEIVGQHFSRFYTSDTSPETWERELTVARSDGRVEAEGWRVRKDGTRFLANEVVTPVRDGDVLRGFAKVTRDITERVKEQEERDSLQSQLHRAQKLETVGQLAGGIAHDFNNLLSVVLNCSNFLLDEVGPDQEIREDIEEIKSAASRAASLTRQLLVFSRRDMAQPEPFDLGEIVLGVEKLIRRAVGQNVVVEIDVAPDLSAVFGNAGEMEQVLMNLAINARDAMSGSGVLSIHASNLRLEEESAKRYLELGVGDYVMLRVTDTGCGMSADVKEKAFEPFFTTKDKGSGTGLGLATVYAIVKQAGGHVEIRSQEGLGTTFEILLPVVDASKIVGLRVEGEDSAQGGNETVLLVEDEEMLRRMVRELLESSGYHVLEAAHGDEAVRISRSYPGAIHAMLTDVIMPGLTGPEVARVLCALRTRMKVLYVSGYTDDAPVPTVKVQEGTAFLQKPFTPAALEETLRQLLDAPTA
jgi:PAS domain S-box-containing protein